MKTDTNSRILAGLWRDLVNPEKRMESEGPFLFGQFNTFECKRVFDACSGMGVVSIYLLQRAYEVTSNEIDRFLREEAREYAAGKRVLLKESSHDWRNLLKAGLQESFDAVLCLGNSLTYLFEHENQLRALANFRMLLKKGGRLFMDMRNYPRMLKERKSILNNPEAFGFFNKYVYCGTDLVPITPIVLEGDEVVLKYTHLERDESGFLRIYPFRLKELVALAKEAGFSKVSVYSDYKSGKASNACFFQLVCEK